jgi:hypothetical protein
MNTYTQGRVEPPLSSRNSALTPPGRWADYLSLPLCAATAVLPRLPGAGVSHGAILRPAAIGACATLKIRSASTIEQLTGRRSSAFATASHMASASQKAAAIFRYLRCVN